MWGLIAQFVMAIALPVAKKVMVGVGVGAVTYVGMKTGMDALQGQIFSQFAGLPATIVQILGIMNVDDAINIIFSAFAARAAISGWSNGQKTKTRIKLPTGG